MENNFFGNIPAYVKALGLAFTGLLGILARYQKLRGKKIRSRAALLAETKKRYIESQVEVLKLTESNAKKRKLLIEMQNFCNECYEQAIEKTGIEINELL